jgi:hypothetical protein
LQRLPGIHPVQRAVLAGRQVDLFDSVPELKVPVFFMEGRSD